MKKLLSVAAVALAISGLFLSCATTGGAAPKAEGGVPSVPHPRSYEVDPADGGATLDVAYNQYGPNYQGAVPNLWKLLKADKPLKGDTVNLKMKITSDTDIPGLTYYLIDNSPAANYWTVISDDYVTLDVKAGEPVVVEQEVTLTTDTKGGFQIIFCYDGSDHGQDAYAKVGKVAKLSFEKIGNTTDTAAELVAATGVTLGGPKTINVAIDKIAAFCEIQTNHPWVNGVQDMSVIQDYANTVSIDTLLDDVVNEGDTIVVTWHAVSNVNIPVLYCRPVDHSQSVGYWSELCSFSLENFVIAENVVAGEPFTVEKTYVLEKGSESTDVILNIWYDYDAETNGPGPATILLAR